MMSVPWMVTTLSLDLLHTTEVVGFLLDVL